jgi:hypothetical protein
MRLDATRQKACILKQNVYKDNVRQPHKQQQQQQRRRRQNATKNDYDKKFRRKFFVEFKRSSFSRIV